MYNDYYLQNIDNKMSTLITNTNTIIEKQNTIIYNQTIINDSILTVASAIAIWLIFNFVVRCFK